MKGFVLTIFTKLLQIIKKVAALGFMAGSIGVLAVILYRILVLLGKYELYKEIEGDFSKQFAYYQSFAILLSFLFLPLIEKLAARIRDRFHVSNKFGITITFFVFIILLDLVTWVILNSSNVPIDICIELRISLNLFWYKMMLICLFAGATILVLVRYLKSLYLNFLSKNIFEKLKLLSPPLYSLYLRPFDTDNKLIYDKEEKGLPIYYPFSSELLTRDFSLNVEKELATTLEDYFPLIGLGKNNLNVSGRIKTSNNEWRNVFKILAQRSSYIFVIPAENEGTFFEVSWIKKDVSLLEKTIFIMPPSRTSIYNHERWEKIMKKYLTLNLFFPLYSETGAFFRVAPDGNFKKLSTLLNDGRSIDKISLLLLLKKTNY